MDTIYTTKKYVTRFIAKSICEGRGIEKLPRKGQEIITSYPIYYPVESAVLGKDSVGYYSYLVERKK